MMKWLTLLGLVLVTSPALADNDADARKHFEVGLAHFNSGSYEDAQRQFEHAYILSKRPKLLYNISLAAERAGNFERAAEALQDYIAQDVDDLPALRGRLTELRKRVDQTSAAAAQAPQPAEARPRVEAAQPQILPVVFQNKTRRLSTGSIVGLSVASAGLVVGATFGILALSENGKLRDGCHKLGNCEAKDRNALRRYTILADVGLGVAVAGGVVATVYLLRDKKKRAQDKRERKFQLEGLTAAPFFDEHGGGLVARGRF